MPPGQPGRGTPEGMKAASRPASRTAGKWGADNRIPAHPRQPSIGSRGPHIKDAYGAARGRTFGPVLDPGAARSPDMAPTGDGAPRGQFIAPCKGAPNAKTTGQNPLDTGPLLQG